MCVRVFVCDGARRCTLARIQKRERCASNGICVRRGASLFRVNKSTSHKFRVCALGISVLITYPLIHTHTHTHTLVPAHSLLPTPHSLSQSLTHSSDPLTHPLISPLAPLPRPLFHSYALTPLTHWLIHISAHSRAQSSVKKQKFFDQRKAEVWYSHWVYVRGATQIIILDMLAKNKFF